MSNKIILFSFILVLVSCIKKEGCRDDDALNYDPDATRQDYSCVYESSGYVYWTAVTYGMFTFYGVDSINVYFNDEYIGGGATVNLGTTFCSSPHDISYNQFKIYDQDWPVELKVYDQNNALILNHKILLYEGYCRQTEIFFI